MLEQESNHGSSHYSSNSATQPSFYVAFVNNKHVRTHQTQIYFLISSYLPEVDRGCLNDGALASRDFPLVCHRAEREADLRLLPMVKIK